MNHKLDQLRQILEVCRNAFAEYAAHHQARFDTSGGREDSHLTKAHRNKELAEACERGLRHLHDISRSGDQ